MSRKSISNSSSHSEIDANGLEEATKLVQQIAAVVGTAPALTAMDRKRSLRLRKGGETIIPTVAALSDQFGLSITSHPTTAMVEGAKKAQSLIPLYKQLVQATKNVADQMFSANSTSWNAATVHYTMLKRLAKTNGDLETALAPVNQFFAARSPTVLAERKAKKDAKKAAKAAAAAPTTATSAATTTSASAPASAAASVTLAAPSAPTATQTTPSPAPISPVRA